MAKARLKVYRTDAGFYETVVAAPNQAAALKAWGVRQNLFAEGAADVVTDPAVVKAATAKPGQPLRRPIGSKAAFALEPDAPAAPKGGKARARAKPDRGKLDAAEARRAELDVRNADETTAFDKRQAALDAERDDAEARWRAERDEAEAAVDKARRAYRKAGG